MKFKLQIIGMSCSHCVAAVKSSLEKIEGVTKAEVSLGDNSAIVSGENLNKDLLIEAVDDIGFEVSDVTAL